MHRSIAKQSTHILSIQDVKTIVLIVTMEAEEETQEGERAREGMVAAKEHLQR